MKKSPKFRTKIEMFTKKKKLASRRMWQSGSVCVSRLLLKKKK